MTVPFSKEELEGFREAAQSLKLYRRAELTGVGSEGLIEKLYVDPLPNDHVLHTILKDSTTFIIGRKGTGKSTVFQRAQHELRKRTDMTSAYVDIKTVYEGSQVDPDLGSQISAMEGTLPEKSLERLLLHRAFLAAVIKSIRDEIRNRIDTTFWKRLKRVLAGASLDELFEGLDDLLADAERSNFESVLGSYAQKGKASSTHQADRKASVSSKIGVSSTPSVNSSLDISRSYTESSSDESEYVDVLMRSFDVKKYILQLKELLEKFKIEKLYVFIDDFSELPPQAMQIVVDVLLAPLNNWSDELVKFKIAAYPGRIYYGQIDKSKVDEVNLDLYALYGTGDIVGMEEKAVDFTRRLIERRLEHYAESPASRFFAVKGQSDLWRQLFYATMANPRNLGYLLFFACEAAVIYNRPISSRVVRDAARRYYEEKINAYFEMNRFLLESFDERSSIFSLKELLENIVSRARSLRRHESSIIGELQGRAPTSHYYVALELEALLGTLELNFFVTKYYVMTDRDGRKVAVYALNYGLCEQNRIEFGRPVGSRDQRFRQYYVERIFDYSLILRDYLSSNQEIVCNSCEERHDYSELDMLRRYGMLCPACRVGTCNVINLSRKYEETLRSIDNDLLLPQIELGILHTLKSEGRPLVAADVAGDLDCSYQLIGKRVKALAEKGLVDRDNFAQSKGQRKRQYTITPLAERTYLQGL